jgi:hypothetical protein
MNALLSILRGGLAGFVALAVPAVAVAGPEAPILVAQADCYSVGQQVAAQNGGQLAKATEANQDGRRVCVIVVLVPGKDGQRPRRTEVVVPLD